MDQDAGTPLPSARAAIVHLRSSFERARRSSEDAAPAAMLKGLALDLERVESQFETTYGTNPAPAEQPQPFSQRPEALATLADAVETCEHEVDGMRARSPSTREQLLLEQLAQQLRSMRRQIGAHQDAPNN